MNLPNETKIRFCNAFHALLLHRPKCSACWAYLYNGTGDLCGVGKDIIALEMGFADTSPEPPTPATAP